MTDGKKITELPIDIQRLSQIEIGATITASITPQGVASNGQIEIEIPVSSEKLKLSKEDLMKWAEGEIQNISSHRQFRIDTIMPAFSLNGNIPKSEFNTLVLVNVPYVFYLPDYLTVVLHHPLECRVKFLKQWTERVKESNNFNATSERRLYFRNFDLKTPLLPLDSNNGASIRFTGKNIEKDGDNNGEYRYSTLLIESDTNFQQEDINNNQRLLEEIKGLVLQVVVYLTRIYKYCSQDFSIRFKEPTIVEIFYPAENLGFYVIDGALMRDATINNTKKEIAQFQKLTQEGFEPSLDEILLMDAKSAFIARDYKLAILEAFQSIDVFLETFMSGGFTKKGMSQADIEQKLNQTWKTRERVEKLLIELCGKGLSQIDGKIGSAWHDLYENVRNAMIHRGYQPSSADAKKAIDLNADAIAIIKKQI